MHALVQKEFVVWENLYTDIFLSSLRRQDLGREEVLQKYNTFVGVVCHVGTRDDQTVLALETYEISLSHKQLWHRFLKFGHFDVIQYVLKKGYIGDLKMTKFDCVPRYMNARDRRTRGLKGTN